MAAAPTVSSASERAVLAGFMLGAGGVLILPLGDALAKDLALRDFHVFQIAWGRWLSHLLILTPIVLVRYRGRRLWPLRPGLHLLRAACMATGTILYFQALKTLPLADAAAILFIAPLLVTAFSALLLHEKVGPRRWIAVMVGFAGMLLIVRPSWSGMDWGSLFALITAFLFTFYVLMTRRVANENPPLVTLWFMGLVGTIVMTPVAIPVWTTPALFDVVEMAGIGATMALGHLLLIRALDLIEASAMAPLPYLEMVSATALGYFWFGDFPDALTWVGCAVVVAAGLFVAYRERVASRAIDPSRD